MEENTSITIKKNSLWKYGFFIIIAVIGIFIFVNASGEENNPVTGNVIADNSAPNGDTQKITLGVKNYNYYPNTITVKEDQPVELTLDKSVSGCLRSFNIKDLGVRGYDKITFTPTQKGTFGFSCAMGMGYGTLIVE